MSGKTGVVGRSQNMSMERLPKQVRENFESLALDLGNRAENGNQRATSTLDEVLGRLLPTETNCFVDEPVHMNVPR